MAADEIRREGHAGWGNTCEQAADAIDAWQSGWQPIETAPRDGTRVLLARCRDDGSYEWMYVAWCRRTQWRISENVARNYYSTVDSEPTHWQPLPDPPKL